MNRLWKYKMMPALLVGTMAFSYGTVGYAKAVQNESNQEKAVVVSGFKDIKSHWAQGTIERMAEYKIINGYPDFTFRPNEPVTQLQAVTMVINVLKQKSVDLVTTGNDYIGEVPAWAKESVGLALYNDLVSWEDMKQFNEPATRIFVVNLLVNGLEADSDSINEGNLSFKDIANLSSEEKTNLSIALQNNLVAGYNDNTFQPKKPVTRAEMAAFSNRLFDQIEVDDYDFNDGFEQFEMVTGIISRIAADVKELTIGSATFGTGENLTVKINGKAAKFNDLTIGLDVQVVLKDKKIVEINASKREKDDVEVRQIVTGSISSIDQFNKKIIVGYKTFGVADKPMVEINGELAEFSFLKNQMEVVLVVVDNKIESIYAFEIKDQNDKNAEGLEFKIKRVSNDNDVKEAKVTGDDVNDETPDLDDGKLWISLNGATYKRIDLEEIDGGQSDGEELAEELEKAIEDALNDDRVKVTFDEKGERFIFETKDSPSNKVPTIQFNGDSAVLNALGLDENQVKGSLEDESKLWKIIVESDAEKTQTFKIEITVDDEDIKETETFTVHKGDTAEEIAEEIADVLEDNSDIRSAFEIEVDDEEVILTADDEDWDVEIDINEK